jgi:acyl-CoA synthetase (AMP-forming)/AMP-acid ligase II
MRWHNLGDLIDRSGDLDKGAVIDLALPGEPRRYSHRQIDELSNGVARYLTERGFARGTHIAIVAFNRAEYIIAYFGIMRAGCVAVPVNIKVARDTVDYIMDDAKISLAFVDGPNRALVRDGIPVIDFDDIGACGFAGLIKPSAFDSVVAAPDEVGQMLYTSGSTGRPKGVPLSHHGQLWALSTRVTARNEGERYVIAQPLFHMNGLFAIKSIFAGNASVVLLPSFQTKSYIEAIANYGVTAASGVPTMWARVIKERELLADNDITSIRRLMLGSAPMTMGLWDKIKDVLPEVTLTIGYGTTEAGPAVFGPHPKGIPTPPLALGYPIDLDAVKLVNGSDNEGVLLMRNPALMDHYHNLPQQTAKAIDDGWYNSGDVMRRDDNGFYYFVGRADDMFVCAGENIYPGEVEKLLERHPEVQQAAVVPLPDEERSQVPVAFIVTRADAQASADDIRKFTIANGPAYQHPRRIEFVNELPWAGTNKIDRKSLIERARKLEASQGWST